jgi:hypothetical protein
MEAVCSSETLVNFYQTKIINILFRNVDKYLTVSMGHILEHSNFHSVVFAMHHTKTKHILLI